MSAHTHYVSIDFGASGCAMALAIRGMGSLSKPKPDIRLFTGWDDALMSSRQPKCPTILLANPQGKFVSFGNKALDDYKRLKKSEFLDYYLFERFKMKLYDAPHEEMIEAANGKCLPAVDIFAMTLKFLKDKATEQLHRQNESSSANKAIQWIITVPSIWTDAAKDVMRKAAIKINLEKESMVFAYDLEAAALFTKYDFLCNEKNFTQFCYLVVDCGGGTVDLAAHKAIKQHGNITIEDLVPPHGSTCGGFAVNDQFEALMKNILNIPAEKFKELKINCAEQWTLLIHQHFEEIKIWLNPENAKSPMPLMIASKIRKEVEKITGISFEKLIAYYGDENIEWDDDESSIMLSCSAIDKLFEPVLNDICTLIKSVLVKQECNEVKTILLVGGFAESYHLFDRIKVTFGKDYEVCRSSDPTYSVAIGAVLCSQQENLIKPLSEKMGDLPAAISTSLTLK